MPKVKYTAAQGLYQTGGIGVVGLRVPVQLCEDQASATTIRVALVADESGKILLIPALTSGTQTINLPTPDANTLGVTYTFILTGTAGQIFNVYAGGTYKIVACKPDGAGNNSAIGQAYDNIGFKAAAVIGSQFTVTCVSTTAGIAWFASNVVDGLAANVGSINLS